MATSAALTDEFELIQSAQRGERQAFAALIARYWEGLYRWLYHLSHDAAEAEDIAQESCLRALTGLASFQAGTNFRAWLFRIAHNQWSNRCRASQKERLALPRDLPARGETPLEMAMGHEAVAHLASAVEHLPSDYRAAFLLRVEQELSFREIAEILDITAETARWRVCKARQKLMSALKPHLDPS
jgi:RNA polymerase sigma-70 factor, ECF subfamily